MKKNNIEYETSKKIFLNCLDGISEGKDDFFEIKRLIENYSGNDKIDSIYKITMHIVNKIVVWKSRLMVGE